MGPEAISDEELVQGFREGDPGSRKRLADELFGRYYQQVGRWCLRFTGEREAAADLAQDVFVKAYRHLESFQGKSKFSTWLYVIARNECFNRSSSAAGKAVHSGEEMLATLPDETAGNAYDTLARESSNRQLRSLLQETLDDTERQVFTLHFGDDMPLDAITRLLRLSNASGAKAYIVSARRKLARAVDRLKAREVRP